MKLDPISTTGVHVRQGAKSFSPFVQGGVDIGAVAQRGAGVSSVGGSGRLTSFTLLPLLHLRNLKTSAAIYCLLAE